jgi:uncharacterized RmlC-like cupin family protein
MQLIPPGSRSGKHRHLAEECVYVLEGKGYDLHQDSDCEITDTINPELKKFEREAGDYIYIPPNTVHQHFNADPSRPVRLISSTARIFRQMGLNTGVNTLEQFDDAPEYDPYVRLDDELVRKYLRGEIKPK